jgi:hypothetical protein
MDRILKDLFGFEDEPTAPPATPPAAPSAPPAPEATATEAAKATAAEREARREIRKRRKADRELRRKRDEFVARYTTGDHSEGFTTQEAIEHLRDMQEELTPSGFRKAMQHTLENLPPSQRDEFIALMQQHKAGQAGAASASAGATVKAASADPFGGLLTSLMGGAAGAGGAGFGSLLDDLAKGGLRAPSRGSGEKPTEQDFQDLLNSPLGRAVLGGVAAYGMQQMQQDDDDYDTPSGRRARA